MKQPTSSDDPDNQETVPLYQQPPPSAPHYYGTFQGPPPGFPQPVHPSQAPHYHYQIVPGYPVIEGVPVEQPRRLPCCGIGLGWFLFIIGWFLATIPWYVGVIILICTRHDRRERIGLVCCALAAVLSLIAIIIGGTQAHLYRR